MRFAFGLLLGLTSITVACARGGDRGRGSGDRDAGPVVRIDAGPGVDGGRERDAGGGGDDAGPGFDAGRPTDAGGSRDAGRTRDAGRMLDAGRPVDAGPVPCVPACLRGEVCVDGTCRLVPTGSRSCRDLLAAAPGTPSGTYTIDYDGAGARAPFTAYCDMTTAGGGWTLTYKVRNDVDSSTNPWWNMVMPGAGTTFPTALTRPTGIFEGPDSATRAALTTGSAATEWRATMRRDGTGEVVADVRSSYTGDPARGLRCFAAGTCSTEPTQSCSPSPTDATVIAAAPGMPLAAGMTGHVCDIGWTDCGFCVDWGHVSATMSMGEASRELYFVGDSSISRTDTTTYFWVR